jgi:hypothetical protein
MATGISRPRRNLGIAVGMGVSRYQSSKVQQTMLDERIALLSPTEIQPAIQCASNLALVDDFA